MEAEKPSQKMPNQDEKVINAFRVINPDSENLVALVRNIANFNQELTSMKDISNLLTEDNVYILQNLNYRDNIKINLLLVKIYINIISNQSLYSIYLVEYTEEKLHLILQIIDECITLITKLPGFILDPIIFKFKEKTMSFIKCIYFNWKGKITNLPVTQKLEEYIDMLPEQLYSEPFNKMNIEKDSLNILNSIDLEKIKNFEDKFQQINNYFEQFEIFKKFVEYNSGIVNYVGIGEYGEEKKDDNVGIGKDKINFYQQYGMLLLKFCKYHRYIFLNQENKEKDEEEEENGKNIFHLEEDNSANTRVVFLLDKIKQYKDNEPQLVNNENENKENTISKEGGKNIAELMNQKSFISINECKEYNDLIKKEINKYIEITKEFENDTRLKSLIEQMNYFLSSIEKESYVPLYLTNFGKINVIDNFTPSFMINVPAGKTNEFYLETKSNETMLIFIEFNLENNSKDINFEVNKYEIYSNEFKEIFKEEKVEKKFKLFLLSSGYALYQIIFDNYYSWFTSKDINYKITLLKMDNKPVKDMDLEGEKKEDEKEEKKEEEEKEEEKEEKEEKNENNEDLLKCNINGKKLDFNIKKICEKIKSLTENKDENIINIPVILHLDNIRVLSFQENKYSIKEYKTEDEEELISQLFFGLKMKHYLSKVLKLKPVDIKDKNINISIFSQNRNLSLSKEISEKIKSSNKKEEINCLQKLGFIPPEEIEGGYKANYKVYDLCEQYLLYYLFTSKNNKEEIKDPILMILFDNKVTNAALFNNGIITTNINEKISLDTIDINNERNVMEFLKNVSDVCKDIKIVLSCFDYKEDEKKNLEELIEKIKKYCEEEIKVKLVVCNENQIANNVFNYMNLFYEK